jgi:hypothetical protein
LGYICEREYEDSANEKSPKTLICKEFQGFYLLDGWTGPISNQYLEDLIEIQRLKYLINSNELGRFSEKVKKRYGRIAKFNNFRSVDSKIQ